MAGKLSFTLGIVTGGFLSGIAGAEAKIKGFIGSMVSMGAIAEGVMHAIETGAELEHLHKRTGESVRNLVKLQSGFKAAGLAAEDVGPALFHLQKALGGVNEFGQGTATTFNRMHLSISKLKNMGAPQAMAAILGSLKGMNQSDAVKAASVIFGRGEAGNMIQLARSSGEFAEGMAKAAAKADLMEANSKQFAKLVITMDQIRDKAVTLFAGIAAGLAPGIQQVEDLLNNIDLSGIGKDIGGFLAAFVQAFKEGSLSELIGETFRTGFEIALAVAPAIFEKLGYFLLVALQTPLTAVQGMLDGLVDYTIAGMVAPDEPNFRTIHPENREAQKAQLAKIKKLHGQGKITDEQEARLTKDANSLGGFGAENPVDVYHERFKKGLELYKPGYGLNNLNEDSDKALKEGLARAKEIAKPLMAMVAGLASRAPRVKDPDDDIERGGAQEIQGNYKPDFTSLEKMGFVMSGLGNADYGPRIADITARGADAAEKTSQFIQDFLNSTHPEWTPVHEPS